MYANVEFEMATAQCRDYIFTDIGASAISVSKSGYYQEYRNIAAYIIGIILLVYSYNCKIVCMQILEWIITSLNAMGR